MFYVQVYNDKVTSRNEIILDVDIVFASDMEVISSLLFYVVISSLLFVCGNIVFAIHSKIFSDQLNFAFTLKSFVLKIPRKKLAYRYFNFS